MFCLSLQSPVESISILASSDRDDSKGECSVREELRARQCKKEISGCSLEGDTVPDTLITFDSTKMVSVSR